MTVKKDRSTQANRDFWDAVAQAAEIVKNWPAWKRGESAPSSDKPDPAKKG